MTGLPQETTSERNDRVPRLHQPEHLYIILAWAADPKAQVTPGKGWEAKRGPRISTAGEGKGSARPTGYVQARPAIMVQPGL